jgi:hypothetical protein
MKLPILVGAFLLRRAADRSAGETGAGMLTAAARFAFERAAAAQVP